MRFFVRKKFLSIFFLVFTLLEIVITVTGYFVYRNSRTQNLNSLLDKYAGILEQQEKYIESIFNTAYTDLSIFISQRSIVEFVKDPSDPSVLMEDIWLLSRNNNQYRQIRLLDTTGRELIRVNNVDNHIQIVPDSLLQDKSHRSYFSKSRSLKSGEIYVSPIDLNMEHGKVELPYERVVRYVTPIYSKTDEFLGMVVINHYLNDVFLGLEEICRKYEGRFMVLNAGGYWLQAPDEYPSFGFVFDSLKGEKFSSAFPNAWNYFVDMESGIFQTGKDYFVFRRVPIVGDNKNTQIYLIVEFDSDANASLAGIDRLYLLLLAGSTILIFIVSYVIARLRYEELQHLRQLSVLNNTLEQKVDRKTNQLSQANAALHRKNEEMQQFVYIASHDLQEPLRTIISFSDILLKHYDDKLDEHGKTSLKFIGNASARMKELIYALLDLSRIGNVKKKEKIDCNELLKSVLDDMRGSIKKSGAEVNYDKLPKISGYRTEFRQLLQNLLSNAIKYQHPDIKPIVHISAQRTNEGWRFSVADNGIGIDEKHQTKVFQIFQRLHTNNEYQGVGIGLAHCKKILELHGGDIWFKSKPGRGTTFYFSISN